MKEIAKTDTIFAQAKTGKVKCWMCRVVTDGTDFYLVSEAWTTDGTKESKHNISTPSKVKGVNIGKSNETTDKEQAIFEMGVKYRKKEDSGYGKNKKPSANATVRGLILPMLANKFKDKAKKVKFPVAIQPKFNGIRCLYDGTKHWSRKAKLNIPECVAHLHFNTDGNIVDGELILPNPYTFQQGIKASKKFDAKMTPMLEYHVYDVVSDKPFKERIEILRKLVKNSGNSKIKISETLVAKDESEVMTYHSKLVAKGFEGTIIRSLEDPYLIGHRSNSLLKLKDFIDDEFKIVGFTDGVGREEKAIIYECVTPTGKVFTVRPEGTMEERQALYKVGKSLIGKKLTVKFQAWSDSGIPYIVSGIGIRDYEG